MSATAMGEETEVADTHEASGKGVEEKAPQELLHGQVIKRCWLAWAESRQRKVTWSPTKETRRWLEMATRWV